MRTFDNFVTALPLARVWTGNPTARHIYDEILSRPDVIARMAMASELGYPALSACVREIVCYCLDADDSAVDVNDPTVRQCVGRMVREVMESVGYSVVEKSCGLTAKQGARPFMTAARYKRTTGQLTVTLQRTTEEDCPISCIF